MRSRGWCCCEDPKECAMPPARPDALALPALAPACSAVALRRRATDVLVTAACGLAAALVLLPLALLLAHVIVRGAPGLRWEFFTHLPKPVGEPGGGMANAIVGTLMLVGLGALVAVPLGVGTGIYLAEIGRGRFASAVRYTADVLAGVPSIVIGVASFGPAVLPLGH